MNAEALVGQITHRRTEAADIEAEHAVFVAAESELLRRHGFGWAASPPIERVAASLRHFLAHDGDRCFVAERGGRVVGYVAVWVRGDVAFLAALFVHPDAQGIGVGRRLLDLAFADAPARRMTITDAIQPVSNALYARYGMLPATPILEFKGDAARPAPTDLVASEPGARDLAALDVAAYGFDRTIDHALWATQARPILWRRGRDGVAYSYRWASGRIGPIAGRDAASAAEALRAELMREPTSWVEMPGSSRSLVRAAIESGMRLQAPPGLLLLSDDLEPPRALAISSYGLL